MLENVEMRGFYVCRMVVGGRMVLEILIYEFFVLGGFFLWLSFS